MRIWNSCGDRFWIPKGQKTLKRTVYKGNGPLMNINRGHKGQKRPMFPHTFIFWGKIPKKSCTPPHNIKETSTPIQIPSTDTKINKSINIKNKNCLPSSGQINIELQMWKLGYVDKNHSRINGFNNNCN